MQAVAPCRSSAASVPEASATVYTDTSALVKLVVAEAETDALTASVNAWERIVTSEITAIELHRAVKRARTDGRADVSDDRTVLEVLAALDLVYLTDDVRALAASSEPPALRTLDAIHLASALTLHGEIDLFVTYDDRLEEAAKLAGITTARPT
jgi:predicted nucleic acid-binding protein